MSNFEAFLISLGFRTDQLKQTDVLRNLVAMNFKVIENLQTHFLKGYFDFAIITVPFIHYANNLPTEAETNVRISYGDPNSYTCPETTVFPAENVTVSSRSLCPSDYEVSTTGKMDTVLARDIIIEARDNRAKIQTTINERNLSVDTVIGASPSLCLTNSSS